VAVVSFQNMQSGPQVGVASDMMPGGRVRSARDADHHADHEAGRVPAPDGDRAVESEEPNFSGIGPCRNTAALDELVWTLPALVVATILKMALSPSLCREMPCCSSYASLHCRR
jgi:hypothetical protein